MSTLKVNPVMYLISSPRVDMSKGKFAAQAGHATQLALELTPDDRLSHIWRWCGGHYAKVVLMSDDLDLTAEYLRERGFSVAKVIDEGRTEFGDTLTTTFLGVQVLDKNNAGVAATFSQFKLYRDRPAVNTQDPLGLKERDGEEKHSFIDKLKERARAYTSRRDSGHA